MKYPILTLLALTFLPSAHAHAHLSLVCQDAKSGNQAFWNAEYGELSFLDSLGRAIARFDSLRLGDRVDYESFIGYSVTPLVHADEENQVLGLASIVDRDSGTTIEVRKDQGFPGLEGVYDCKESVVSAGHADLGFDGCFQLYQTSAMFPIFCLEGTAEEGIGGSGVRLVIFETNSDQVSHCSRSSGSAMTSSHFEFELNAMKEFSLDVLKTQNGRKSGSAVFGHTQLSFAQIDKLTSDQLMAAARSTATCIDVGW